MFSHKHQTLIGTAAILIFTGILLYMFVFKADFKGNGVTFYVTYKRLGHIETGAPVKIGHIKVGKVENISLNPKNPERPVRLTLFIRNPYASSVYVNSAFYMESLSFIGKQHINISLPDEKSEIGRPVRNGDVVKGIDPSNIDAILKLSFEAMEKHLEFFRSIEKDRKKIGRLIHRIGIVTDEIFSASSVEFNKIKDNLNKIKDTGKIKGLFNTLKQINTGNLNYKLRYLAELTSERQKRIGRQISRLDTNINLWQDSKLKNKVQTIKNRFEKLQRKTEIIYNETLKSVKILQSTDGTIGALAKDREIYDDLKQMAKRLKNNLTDIIFKKKEKMSN